MTSAAQFRTSWSYVSVGLLGARVFDGSNRVPKPVLQALLLADHIYQDKDTGKKIIAGTFNSLSISKTKAPTKGANQGAVGRRTADPDVRRGAPDPAAAGAAARSPQDDLGGPQHIRPRPLSPAEVSRLGNPTAFVSLTDVHGPTDLELRYVDLADHGVLMMVKFRVLSDDPLKTVEAILPVPPLPTPHPGVYALELLCDGEPLGSLRVAAVEVPDAPPVP